MTTRAGAHRLAAAAAGAGFVVFWSCGFIGARWGTQYTSAFDLLAWRFLLAGAMAAVILLIRRPAISRRDLVTQVWMAFLTQFVYLGLIFTGIDHGITAGRHRAHRLAAAAPDRHRGRPAARGARQPRQWIGLVLGVAGVGLVVADDLNAGHGSPLLFLVPLGGLLGLVIGTCLDRRESPAPTLSTHSRPEPRRRRSVHRTGRVDPPTHRAGAAGLLRRRLWLVLLATGGGWGLYLVNLKLSGATRISSLLYLVPPTTMVFAFLLFGETIGVLAVDRHAGMRHRRTPDQDRRTSTLRGWRNPGG